jgi:nicotinamide-nucleotide amidase
MIAAIISIGDELLIGQVVNTNASYIAEHLNLVGVDVKNILTVGDNEAEILEAFDYCFKQYELILVTGGLGPTHDDVTRSALCKFFDTKLIVNKGVKENVKKILSLRKLNWTSAAENQTLVPEGCKIIPNKYGTAAGMLFERANKFFFVMPGVPFEMKSMMNDYITPFLQGHNQNHYIQHRTLNTTGITESSLSELLGDLEQISPGARLAFLPSPTGVKLRISVQSRDAELATTIIKKVESNIRTKAENYIYGTDEEEIEDIIGKLLTNRKLKLAVAESCTGGLITDRLTNIPGSSQYFERGVVVYSNESKTELLNIPKEMISKYGAVSKEVAEAMAEDIRINAQVDIGLSTTGIAGPTGGTLEKPVGLVWIGYADRNKITAEQFLFGNDRLRVKIRASQAALNLIRKQILNIS